MSLDERDMIETIPSAPNSDMLQWTLVELKLWGLVEPIEKKFEILIEYSLKNKESIKKTVCDSEFKWGRYDLNKPKMGHGGAIQKKLGACDTLKIKASVEGQNWESKTALSCS